MSRSLIGVLIVIAGLATPAAATTIQVEWEFSSEDISYHAAADGYELPRIGTIDARAYDEDLAGKPSLPVLTTQVLLPYDQSITSVSLRRATSTQSGPHLALPVQRPFTVDGAPPPEFVSPDSTIYSSATAYPANVVQVVGHSWCRGYRCATVEVFPLQYVGADTAFVLSESITATFTLAAADATELSGAVQRLRPIYKKDIKEDFLRWLSGAVENPDDISGFYHEPKSFGPGERPYGGFQPSEMPSLDSPPVEYAIVTAGALVDSFQVLANWKTRSGTPTVVRTVSWIDSHYGGVDVQERIRNFIRDAHVKWGTEYVLLGGDTAVVPDRFFESTNPSFKDPPVDWYYAALDGTWNNNNDSSFGDGTDYGHEVMVARAPVTSLSEAGVFVRKVRTYARSLDSDIPSIDESHYGSLLLMAGNTNNDGDGFENGVYAAEVLQNAVANTADPDPAVMRLYENYFFDGTCGGISGDTCQEQPGIAVTACSRHVFKMGICTGSEPADSLVLILDPQGALSFTSSTFASGEWEKEYLTPYRLAYLRSSAQPANTCELMSPAEECLSVNFSGRDDCTFEMTERLYNGAELVHEDTENDWSPCSPWNYALIRTFLCNDPDSGQILTQSVANRFNQAGMEWALSTGYGYVFHQEHSSVNHLGGVYNHSRADQCCLIAQYPSTPRALHRRAAAELDSNHRSGIFYSVGSYQNAVDKNAISETLMLNPNGGAVAYLAKQRSTYSELRQMAARDFFINCFDKNAANTLGLAAYQAMTALPTRETTVELLLLGDPTMPLYCDTLKTLEIDGDGLNAITGLGPITLEFEVTDGDSAVEDALVCLTQNDPETGAVGGLLYLFGWTDESGTVVLDVDLEFVEDIEVVAVAPNVAPTTATITVNEDEEHADLVYESHFLLGTISDVNVRAKAGHSGYLRVTLENRGGATADSVEGILWPWGTVTFDLRIQDYGPEEIPEMVFIGPDLRNPPTVPFTLDQLTFSGVNPDGKPDIPLGEWGYFLWLDTDRKWYIKWRGDEGGEVFEGEITTSGGFHSVEEWMFEKEDTSSGTAGDDVVSFTTTSSSSGDEDGLKLRAKDHKNFAIQDQDNPDFGDIQPGHTAYASFEIGIPAEAQDRHEALIELEISVNGHPGGYTTFTIPITAPDIVTVKQTPQQLMGPMGPGDPYYQMYVTVRNHGTAVADSVAVRIENEVGATIVTGTAVVGELESEDEATTGPLVFTAADLSAVRLTVSIDNTYITGDLETITWESTNVDVIGPSTPTNLEAFPGAGGTFLRWTEVGNPAGYNVYRRVAGGGTFDRVNPLTLPEETTFFDSGQLIPLNPETTYEYHVRAVDESRNESLASSNVEVGTWLAQVSGWPKRIDVGTNASPLVVDIDDDGYDEIMLAGRAVYAWHHDGTEVVDGDSDSSTVGVFYNGFPGGDQLSQDSVRFTTCLAALPGEFIVGYTYDGEVYFWDPDDGSVLDQDEMSGGGSFSGSPVLADIDLDDNTDILIYSAGNLNHWEYVNGTFTDKTVVSAGGSGQGGVAVGNLDTDAQLEIVVTSQGSGVGKVKALDHNIVTQLWIQDVANGEHASPPVLHNLDVDAYDEVVIAFNNDSADFVVALDHDGTVLPSSWPVDIGQIGDLSGRIPSPAVADIVGDSAPEIIVGNSSTQQIRILNANGTDAVDAWLLEHLREYTDGERKGSETTATVVDADDDGFFEVLHGTNMHQVAAWDPDAGELESGWPILVRESVRGQVRVADIDNEGGMEVIVADKGGWIHIWEYDEVEGFQGPKPREVGTMSTVVSSLEFSYPNPSNPTTVIPYVVASNSEVSVRVYSPIGRFVRELAGGRHEPGRHEVVWDGRDSRGVASASGVYFYELRVDGQRIGSRKLLVIR